MHMNTVHLKLKPHKCNICKKNFGRKQILQKHVKKVHDGVSRIKNKKQVETAQKGSKNVKDSKKLKMMEKEALNVSNIAGFDHENQIADKEPKIKQEIKQEVKIEPMDENTNE